MKKNRRYHLLQVLIAAGLIVFLSLASGCGDTTGGNGDDSLPCEGEDCEEPCEGEDCEEPCEGEDCEEPCEGEDCGEHPQDPCGGVLCDDPPVSQCQSSSILGFYESPGNCIDGECIYEYSEKTCSFGCDSAVHECRQCLDTCNEGDTQCREGRLRTCIEASNGCHVWSDFESCPENVCSDPYSCGTCDEQPCGNEDGCCPPGCSHHDDPDCSVPLEEHYTTWLLLLADFHFGGSSSIAADLTYLLDTVAPVIDASAIVNAGDTVETGNVTSDWEDYFSIIENRVPPAPEYFEVPGNHDVKGGGIPNYLAFTQSGRSGLGLHGQSFIDGRVEPYAGRIRVIRTNTSESNLNPANVLGYFTQEQADELTALPIEGFPPDYTVLAAHHPITGIQQMRVGVRAMENLIEDTGAVAYLCGHAHIPRLSWLKNTLVVQASSVGKSRPPGFSIVSLDPSGPSAIMLTLEPRVAWPVSMITSPADPDLGGNNPYSVVFSPGEDIPVRALAFDPAGISGVQASLAGSSWTDMVLHDNGVWSLAMEAPVDAGRYHLEIKASGGSGSDTRQINIHVSSD